jgi:hypothetical protein
MEREGEGYSQVLLLNLTKIHQAKIWKPEQTLQCPTNAHNVKNVVIKTL